MYYPPKPCILINMKNDNLYRTTVTTLRPGHSTETHVLKVWKEDGPLTDPLSTANDTPFKVHISKDYGYILKMERDYLARKITSICP